MQYDLYGGISNGLNEEHSNDIAVLLEKNWVSS
jgi:hypothetical protein